MALQVWHGIAYAHSKAPHHILYLYPGASNPAVIVKGGQAHSDDLTATLLDPPTYRGTSMPNKLPPAGT